MVNDANAVPYFANTKNLVEIDASDWSIAQIHGFSLVERPIIKFLKRSLL